MMQKGHSVKQDLHIKCLALSSLTGACLTALCYCSFASLNRLLISMHAFSLSRQSAQCDPAYVYIPAVFMLAFYLLYLFECYQCDTRWVYFPSSINALFSIHIKMVCFPLKIRYMLTHHQNDHQIKSQINRLRNSQPIIWWKALNYHYLRRTRLITRYRNGEAFTSTQVYFQRVNSRITSTCYVYDTGGDLNRPNCVDISRKITDLDKYPLVKVKLSKGAWIDFQHSFDALYSLKTLLFSNSRFRILKCYRSDRVWTSTKRLFQCQWTHWWLSGDAGRAGLDQLLIPGIFALQIGQVGKKLE